MEILDYIAERNEPAATHLHERIAHALEQAAEHPYLYKASERIAGMREIVVHPNYVVLYQVTATCIEVVTVSHTRREFPS